MLLMVLKTFLFRNGVSFKNEIFILNLFLGGWLLGFLGCLTLMIKAGNIEPNKNKEIVGINSGDLDLEEKKNFRILETFREIKYEFISLVSITAVNSIIFPGIAFSLSPITLMTKKNFILTQNLAISATYFFSRISSYFDFNHLLVISN